MTIDNARYYDGELCLKCSPIEGVRFVYSFKGGEYDIVKHKEKRSLNANAYAWVLIDKIAEAVKLSPTEVYRNAVRDTGGVSLPPETVELSALEQTITDWVGDHLGRQVKLLPAQDQDHVIVIKVKGSSDYSRRQMANFIDGLCDDARSLGIETKPQEYIDSLLENWERKRNA